MSGFYRPGDVIDVGSGVTWKLSADLAESLNKARFRRDREWRRRRMLP